jgi:hypothetical protein
MAAAIKILATEAASRNLPPVKGKRPVIPKIDYPPDVLEFFRQAGAMGGKTRAKRLTREQRQASARKAGKASGAARRAQSLKRKG